ATLADVDGVGDQLANYLLRDGSNAPSANIGWGGFRITSLGAPVDGTDAANRDFVVSRDRYTADYVDLANETGGTVTAGTVVSLGTTAGELIKAAASAIATCQATVGVVVSNISDSATGKVQILGRISVNTTAPLIPGQP